VKSTDRFAPLVVRHADRRDIADGGVLDEDGVDRGLVDVHAAGDDHVRGAIGEEQVPVVVQVADVSQREVVAPVRRGGLHRVVVVLEPLSRESGLDVDESDLAARQLLPVLVADPHLIVRSRFADGAGSRQPRRVVDERADALGCGVVLPHDGAEPFRCQLSGVIR
jgi:hypothetical protein